ncbi:ethanolamine ammonia-lyase subunit EutB, partial [Sinirhodobacter huangdaonensis]
MGYQAAARGERFRFDTLAAVMAAATPERSGDALAGIAAGSALERVAARRVLMDLPLATFLTEALVPYESDEVTRLILDTHDAAAFAPFRSMTVGALRDWLLSPAATAG